METGFAVKRFSRARVRERERERGNIFVVGDLEKKETKDKMEREENKENKLVGS